MASKMVLGKGIASLISPSINNDILESPAFKERKVVTEVVDAEGGAVMIDVKEIKPNSSQPRKIFKEKEIAELSQSIKENGILQPLLVLKAETGFELIAGERRLRAAKLAGLEKVPVIIKKVTDREKVIMAILENVQREDLNCVEVALSYFQLINDFKLTQEELSKKLGKERSTVANFLRILKLPRAVLELLQKEILTFGHAKVLAGDRESEETTRLANEAATKNLSVRELEELIKKKGKVARESNQFFNEKLDGFKKQLEEKTGFHYSLKAANNGSGTITIKFNNEAEFNDVFEFLLKK